MSVKIEILDYKYGSGDNLVDVNEASSGLSSGWTALNPTNAQWDGSGNGKTYLSNISSDLLVIGMSYVLSFKIYNYNGTGTMGFSTSSGVPSSARFAGNTNVLQSFTFVATGTSFPDLFGRSTNSGNISSISIQKANVVDWENSVVGELDIANHSDFPLAMTFQISDFKDLTSTSGDYSKTFKIPATKNNNQIFKNLYIANIDVDNEVTSKKQCRILVNNLYSQVGLIQVNSVSGYGENPSHYDCVFFGNNLTWAVGIENKYLSNIEWVTEGEGLTYNKDSIVATWQYEDSDNSSNSPIVYPIASYGAYNEGGDERTIQLLDTRYGSGQTGDASRLGYYGTNVAGNDFGTPPPSPDWRPTIFVKQTLEKIFAGLGEGFQISSSFMNTAMFKKLVWSLPNFKYNNPSERYNIYATETSFTNNVDLSVSGTAYIAAVPTESGVIKMSGSLSENDAEDYYNGSGRVVLDINDIVSDPSSYNISVGLDNQPNIDFASDYILVPEYGEYNINLGGLEVKLARAIKGGSTFRVIDSVWSRIAVEVQTVGEGYWTALESSVNKFDINDNVNQSNDRNSEYEAVSDINITSQFLNKGDKIRITTGMKLTATTDNQNFNLYFFIKSKGNSTFNLEFSPHYVEYGQTYKLSDVINKDLKQIDFIKGIAHAFNLQMTTNELSKIVYIEPFNDFYKPLKDAIDWTYKLDRSKEISDKWIKGDLKRTMTFKYKSDNADAVVKYNGENLFEGIQDEYPYKETLPDTFDKGDTTFENPFFAGTYNAKDNATTGIPSINTAYSACLWTENVNPNASGRPPKGYDFLPRLLYWNKYSPANVTAFSQKQASIQTWSSNIEYIKAGSLANGIALLSDVYPQATMINRDSNTSPVLSYGNVFVNNYDDATGLYGVEETGIGLYEKYYRNSIEMLKSNPRIRSAYVNLKISDIINLDFTKLIYIDGVYWRIGRVVDYMPNNNESTKVELLEWLTSLVYPYNTPRFKGRPRNWAPSSFGATELEVPQL
jgi:hypothetical protein